MRLVQKALLLILFIICTRLLSYSQENDNRAKFHSSIPEKESNYELLPYGNIHSTICLDSINIPIKYTHPMSMLSNYMSFGGNSRNYEFYNLSKFVDFKISSSSDFFLGLMTRQSLSMEFSFKYKRIAFLSGGEINRYLYNGIQNQYGLYSNLNFSISNNITAVLYARLYDINPYYSMASYPYVYSSEFGGFLSLQNSSGRLDVGVRRKYDSFRRQWYTAPIITPTIKVGKVHIGLPVGELLYNTIFKK